MTNGQHWIDNQDFQNKVKNNLPMLFRKAELETMRGGKIGMEVGVIRERIIVSLLLSAFGQDNILTEVAASENSKDVEVFGDEISIKTFTNNNYEGVKVFWASDNTIIKETCNKFKPKSNILLAQIKWGCNEGGVFYIPVEVQNEIFNRVGVGNYLKINNRNNRGISINKDILKEMINHPSTSRIEIKWGNPEIEYNVYDRWINEII